MDETGPGHGFAIAGELSAAFNQHDIPKLCGLLWKEVQRIGVPVISEQTGMPRQAIHAALRDHRNPTLAVLLAIIRAVGQVVMIYPAAGIMLPNGPETVNELRETAKNKRDEPPRKS